jgi:cellulose synthase/poly-beta-1,6-N-acetylglucosamine synthase-like glycosyltransferase
MTAWAIIFWISVFLVLHSYLFYPLILRIFSAGRKGNIEIYSEEDDLPGVSVIISAWNEEKHIGQKIESIYKGTYPSHKVEVLIGSDASSDRTKEIVTSYLTKYPSLKYFDFKERRGKGNVVNDLVKVSSGSILVLTDANVMFDPGTLFFMVRHFKNPRIGLVDTRMVNLGMQQEGISFQEKAYISREVKIKNMEGILWGAMMGPFGGCYAIPREDYGQVPSNYLVDDFYINMKVFETGKLAINDLDSVVFESVPDQISTEFRRKTRIGTGNFQNIRRFWKLLFTCRYGFAFFSHKILRWFGPFLLLAALTANILLAIGSPVYLIILAIQLLAFLLPLFDIVLKKMGIHIHALRLSTHFFAMNAALFVGFFKSMGRVSSGVWERTARQ